MKRCVELRSVAGAVGIALSTVVLAEPTEYTWVQGQTTYGDDLTVTYDSAGDIASMTVKSADGVRLTGMMTVMSLAGTWG